MGATLLTSDRLGVAAALRVIIGHGDADRAGVAGRVVAGRQAIIEVLVLDAESRPGPSWPLIDVIVSTAESVDELNVSSTFSVAMPAALRMAGMRTSSRWRCSGRPSRR